MDASGIVIACSEVIRFEKGSGILATVHNKYLNLTFYILMKNPTPNWKTIFVHRYYNFCYLKVGAVKLVSGLMNIVLLTTSKSEFQEIPEHQLQKFNILNHFIEKISIPDVTLKSEIQSFSELISYQGVITKVNCSKFGIYELDSKIHLYCIFNSFRTVLPMLKEGDEVFISNVHFLRDIKTRNVLVCCGLSSIRPIKLEVETVDLSLSIHLGLYELSIYDVIWLEMMLCNLHKKFHATVISQDFIFHWENEILNNILECFSYPMGEILCSKRQSIGDDYCSDPHNCEVFCNDILPTGCEILLISKILEEAFEKIIWSAHSDHWKTSFVQNETNYILIGMLYLSKDGCWYIMDKSCNIPILFSKRCSHCKFSKNIFCSFDNLNLGYLVALQNFEIVYEKITYDFNDYKYYRYLRTSCCYVFYLGTFFKQKDDLFNFISDKQNFSLPINYDDTTDELSQKFDNISLYTQEVWRDVKSSSLVSPCNDSQNNNNYSQHVLVLNKIWTIINMTFVCYQVIVLLLPQEKIYEEYFQKSQSLFDDSNNFYETEDDDDDFAKLVNQMDNLFLDDKPRLARLHFESARQCASVLPGHLYVLDFSGNFVKDINCSIVSNNSKVKPALIKIKRSMKILHHVECLGFHQPDDYQINVYNGIQQIISERKVQENVLIRAVLKDKLYEESFSGSGSLCDNETSKTFCLILKDYNSEDTIKVYLPFCPKNTYGFLPGTQLQLWGFVCMCSRRGHLYLKPPSSFGIQIIPTDAYYPSYKSMISDADESQSELQIAFLKRIPGGTFFKCICFIVRIVSVKLHLTCNSCGKDFLQKCSCLCSYSVKLTMSFIIDDGTDQKLAHCSDETARKILMLKEKEWKKLSSYITARRINLQFSSKLNENDIDSSSLMNRAFSVYCSSKLLCRQVYLKCRKKSDGSTHENFSFWCSDVIQTDEISLIQELMVKLKNIST